MKIERLEPTPGEKLDQIREYYRMVMEAGGFCGNFLPGAPNPHVKGSMEWDVWQWGFDHKVTLWIRQENELLAPGTCSSKNSAGVQCWKMKGHAGAHRAQTPIGPVFWGDNHAQQIREASPPDGGGSPLTEVRQEGRDSPEGWEGVQPR